MGCQRLCDGAGGATTEAIADCLTGAAGFNDALTSQNCQMLRHQRLLQIKIGRQTADALISLNQATNNHETMRVRQRLQEIAGV